LCCGASQGRIVKKSKAIMTRVGLLLSLAGLLGMSHAFLPSNTRVGGRLANPSTSTRVWSTKEKVVQPAVGEGEESFVQVELRKEAMRLHTRDQVRYRAGGDTTMTYID